MIDHEAHLKQVLETQKNLSNEVQELTNILMVKKELFLKLQGIVEYLSSNGIKAESNEKVNLPTESEE